MKKIFWFIVIVIILGWGWWWFSNRQTPPTQNTNNNSSTGTQNNNSSSQNNNSSSNSNQNNPQPSQSGNVWFGTLKISDNPSRGNLMLVIAEPKKTVYINTARDFSSLIDKEVAVTIDGTLDDFTLVDIEPRLTEGYL